MLVEERYRLPESQRRWLRDNEPAWGFGEFSKLIFYTRYSLYDEVADHQETPADVIIRIVEGFASYYLDAAAKHNVSIPFNMDHLTTEIAHGIHSLYWIPSGRNLWKAGTPYVYERGSAALNNCGFVSVQVLSKAVYWAMDHLMLGVGIGFDTNKLRDERLYHPNPLFTTRFYIPDTREGWAESTQKLIESYEIPNSPTIEFDYSRIRAAGQPIRGFGGTSSGPQPLMDLHRKLRAILSSYVNGFRGVSEFITDVMNLVGICVVAGNVRRSAELAMGSVQDTEFMNLKNAALYPERMTYPEGWGYMSNNSVVVESPEDYSFLFRNGLIDRIRDNGEPGILNMEAVKKYARYGEYRPDNAIGFNPCAEIPLASMELCNLVETFPHRNPSKRQLMRTIELATLWASVISLVPSHDQDTNDIVNANHRIGVSMSGIADWHDAVGMTRIRPILREGHDVVKEFNRQFMSAFGYDPSIRLTTVKPSGTVSLLAGASPGMHHPYFDYGIRNVRIDANKKAADILYDAGVPWDFDETDYNTLVFSFPLRMGHGSTRPLNEVSLREQADIAAVLQEDWADNSVSNTLTFNPLTESEDVEDVIQQYAPRLKSMSLLRDQGIAASYKQPPYERIAPETWEHLSKESHYVDWTTFREHGLGERFCSNDTCEIV